MQKDGYAHLTATTLALSELSPETARSASLVCAGHIDDLSDLRIILMALGLMDYPEEDE